MKNLKTFGLLALGAAMVLGLPGAAQAAKVKYTEGTVENGGSVTGKVSFEGALPDSAIENILITKNPDVCGEGEREVVWIDVKDGALRGVFVFIAKIKEGKTWEKPVGGQYIVDQKGCRFRPWASDGREPALGAWISSRSTILSSHQVPLPNSTSTHPGSGAASPSEDQKCPPCRAPLSSSTS